MGKLLYKTIQEQIRRRSWMFNMDITIHQHVINTVLFWFYDIDNLDVDTNIGTICPTIQNAAILQNCWCTYVRGLPLHNQGGGGPGFYPGVQFCFLSEWKYNFFSFRMKVQFLLLPIRPLVYYMTEREWYYGFAGATSASASAYDFWRKHNN